MESTKVHFSIATRDRTVQLPLTSGGWNLSKEYLDMSARDFSISILLATVVAAPLAAKADPTDIAFKSCSQAFVQSLTSVYGPVKTIRVVPPAHVDEEDSRAQDTHYTFVAREPKTKELLARADCTVDGRSGKVSLAPLYVPEILKTLLSLNDRL
jgi:hypothetical protein